MIEHALAAIGAWFLASVAVCSLWACALNWRRR
jgi:hypothetical protein